MPAGALSHLRICDFTGQLAGAGATRFMAAFGAEVIRIEDPTNQGRWDILRGVAPFVDERRGVDMGGAFNNHNVEKLGITLNLRLPAARDVLRRLIAVSDAVTENFAAGVLDRLGFGYDALCAIRPGIVYVSNCGFGHTGPYKTFKTWGPSVQAVSGLTFQSGLPDQPPAGWGYSYMDHTGAYYMAMGIMAALYHQQETGDGQWVDMATTEAAATLNGPALLDYTVNGRPLRRSAMPNSNRDQWGGGVPHGIYPCREDDTWVAISCERGSDWDALRDAMSEDTAFRERHGLGSPVALEGRLTYPEKVLEHEDEIDALIGEWTCRQTAEDVVARLQARDVPAVVVQTPEQRIDHDANTAAWGLWPEVEHTAMGRVRVDGLPVHMSETDWSLTHGAPVLGEHNDYVLCELLGLSSRQIAALREERAL